MERKFDLINFFHSLTLTSVIFLIDDVADLPKLRLIINHFKTQKFLLNVKVDWRFPREKLSQKLTKLSELFVSSQKLLEIISSVIWQLLKDEQIIGSLQLSES